MSGEDHEHLQVLLEGEVLGDGQRAPRREQTLDRGVVGEVQEEDDSLERAGLLELLHEVARLAVGDAHRAEDDRELLARLDPRLADDLRRELVGRQPEPEKIGSFWPRTSVFRPSMARDAGLDEVGRLLARVRVDRRAGDVEALLGDDRRAAVDRLAGAVEDAAEQLGRDTSIFATSSRKRTSVLAMSMPARALEDLDDRGRRRRSRGPGRAARAVRHARSATISLYATPWTSLTKISGPGDVGQRPVVGGEQRALGAFVDGRLGHQYTSISGDVFGDLPDELLHPLERLFVRRGLERRRSRRAAAGP